MPSARDLVEPRDEYTLLKPDDMKGRFNHAGVMRTGFYSITDCFRLTRKLAKKPCDLCITRGFVIVLAKEQNRIKRCMHLRDIELIVIADDPSGGHKALLVSYRRVGDPAILLLLPPTTDTTRPLRILNYARAFHNADEVRTEYTTVDAIQTQYGHLKGPKPKGYLKAGWVTSKRSRQAVNSVRRPANPPGSPVQEERMGPLAIFRVTLPTKTSPIGVEMQAANGRVFFTKVEAYSPAAQAGIPTGLHVSEISNRIVRYPADVADAVQEARKQSGDASSVSFELRGYPPLSGQLSPNHSFGLPPVRPASQFTATSNGFDAQMISKVDAAFQPHTRPQSLKPVPLDSPGHAPSSRVSSIREEELAEKERRVAEREKELAALEEALRSQQQEQEREQQQQPQSPLLFDDLLEQSDNNGGGAPRSTNHPRALRFEVLGDVVEFVPERRGILGEFHNGEKRGIATSLRFSPATRALVDQDGRGGKVPREDPHILRTIASFCEENGVPLSVDGEDFVVRYRSPKGDHLMFTPDLGALGEHFNGQLVGMATELRYDMAKGLLTDQENHGGRLPEENRVKLLGQIVGLCEVCDVSHNIDVEAVRAFDQNMQALDAEKQKLTNLRKEEEMRTRQEEMRRREQDQKEQKEQKERREQSERKKDEAIDSQHRELDDIKEALRMEREEDLRRREDELRQRADALRDEEDGRARDLRRKETELSELERLLEERERVVDEFKASPAGLYHRLRSELGTEDPDEEEVVDIIRRVPHSFFWYDLCAFFEDDGRDLPRLLRSLSPDSVRTMESSLREKGVHLPHSVEAVRRRSMPPDEAAAMLRGVSSAEPVVPVAEEVRPVPVSQQPPQQQQPVRTLPVSNPSPEVMRTPPSFKRMVQTPPLPAHASPYAYSEPVFSQSAPDNAPASGQVHPLLRASRQQGVSPEPAYSTFSDPHVDVGVLQSNQSTAAGNWAQDALHSLEQAHDLLLMGRSPSPPQKAMVHDDIAVPLSFKRGGPYYIGSESPFPDQEDALEPVALSPSRKGGSASSTATLSFAQFSTPQPQDHTTHRHFHPRPTGDWDIL